MPKGVSLPIDGGLSTPDVFGTARARRPVGWVNVASLAAPTGGAGAHGELATVLGYLGADVIAGACVRPPMRRGDVDPDGLVTSAAVLDQLRTALRALRDHVTAAVPD